MIGNGLLPPEIRGQTRLTPRGRSPAFSRNCLRVRTVAQLSKDSGDRLEIRRHGAILNDGVGVSTFVDLAACLEVDGTGVNAPVDLQERHPDTTQVASDKGPETPMRVAVFGTDA